MRGRDSGSGGAASAGYHEVCRDRALAVERTAETVEHATEQRLADVDLERLAGGDDLRARADARGLAERHQQRAAGPEADDLGGHGGAAAAGLDRAHLTDLGLEAGGLGDQPDQVDHAAGAAVQVGLADREHRLVNHVVRSADRVERTLHQRKHLRFVSAGGRGTLGAAQRGGDDFARALELGLDPRVDVADGRAHDRATAGDAALGLDLAVLDAAERALISSMAPRTISRSSGLTMIVIRSRSTMPRSAPWTESSTRSGSTLNAPASTFWARASPSSTARRSSSRRRRLLLAQLGDRRGQRGQGGRECLQRLRAARGVALVQRVWRSCSASARASARTSRTASAWRRPPSGRPAAPASRSRIRRPCPSRPARPLRTRHRGR